VTGQVYMGGGFGDSIRERMSPALQQRLAWEEQAEARENAKIERQREIDREKWHERSILGAAQQAVDRGELITVHQRMSGEGLGHTPAEFIAERVALMDIEDMREENRRRAELRKFQLDQSADASFDVTAAEDEKSRWAQHHAEHAPAVAAKRQARREIWGIIKANESLKRTGLRK
jgi:hypothetical protein